MEPAKTQATQGTPESAGRFVDSGDEAVVDTQTRLMWLKKDTWQLTGKWMNWVQSRDYAEELNRKKFAGHDGWRLPTAGEARTLFGKQYRNKDHMGQEASLPPLFPPGFSFLCWTGDVRGKIQAIRFGYRKGVTMFDDIYRVSRGAARFVRDLVQEE